VKRLGVVHCHLKRERPGIVPLSAQRPRKEMSTSASPMVGSGAHFTFSLCFYGLLNADEEDFPPESAPVLVELVSGSILQAEAVAVEEDQVPYILLTKLNGSQV